MDGIGKEKEVIKPGERGQNKNPKPVKKG